MEIFDFIFTFIFVLFIAFLVIGFNRQMTQKIKDREERFKKFKKGDKNE